jgi:hypothetical protein
MHILHERQGVTAVTSIAIVLPPATGNSLKQPQLTIISAKAGLFHLPKKATFIRLLAKINHLQVLY